MAGPALPGGGGGAGGPIRGTALRRAVRTYHAGDREERGRTPATNPHDDISNVLSLFSKKKQRKQLFSAGAGKGIPRYYR